jgi:hypothetical protein
MKRILRSSALGPQGERAAIDFAMEKRSNAAVRRTMVSERDDNAASRVSRPIIGLVRAALCLMLLAAATEVNAQSESCPLAGQKPMMIVQLFFGVSVPHRGPVTAKEWSSFLRDTVTPRFPDGFTVYDAYGQWLNPATHALGREKSKVVLIAVDDTPTARAKITEVTDHYKETFHQHAVGVLTSPSCGAF